MTGKKPNFNAECERCIAAAKGLAAREGAERLDPVHLIAAAARLAPEAVAKALPAPGMDLERFRLLAARYGAAADATGEPRPMGLVPELRDVVFGQGLLRREAGEEVDVPTLLAALLKHPSFRLKRLLVQVESVVAEDRKVKKDTDIRPYASFRDYLADRQRLWVLRRQAADRAGDSLGAGEYGRKRDFGYSADGILEAAQRLERKLLRRVEATSPDQLATRSFARREGLSSGQVELVEGAFLNDLYVLGEPWEDALTVRAFARMLAPRSYPRNCGTVLSDCQDLIGRDVFEVRHDAVACRLADRVRLTARVQDELFESLGRDGITDGDIRELRYRMEFDSDEA